MRPALLLSLFLLLAAPPASAAAEPSERLIVEMALLHLVREVDIFANASFGPSVVYPQPGYRYWAVVGEAISGSLTGKLRHHVFVVAVRLVCDEMVLDECWRLEKLAVDDRILFDRGDPL
jgi:hypothetical protein